MAGKLPKTPETDAWAEEMSYKLSQLPPSLRAVAERFIRSMLAGEEADRRKTKSKPKEKTSTP
jgi:hypothetical protein